MQPFKTLTSIAAPLDRTNVDTDQIIPKQFLKRIERTGYGEFLFFDWRRTASGDPNPDFELNDPRYQGAQATTASAPSSRPPSPTSSSPTPVKTASSSSASVKSKSHNCSRTQKQFRTIN